jgi:hypothetical protein
MRVLARGEKGDDHAAAMFLSVGDPRQAPYEAPLNGQNLPAESVPQNTKSHVYPLSRFARKWVAAELRERR